MPGILILALILSDAASAGGPIRMEYVPPGEAEAAPAREPQEAPGETGTSQPPRPNRSQSDSTSRTDDAPSSDRPGQKPSSDDRKESPDAPTEGPIESFSQTFRFTTSGWPFAIRAERTLAAAGDGTWMMQLKASNWLGEIRETTRFRWQGCLPRTLSWEYQRTGLGQDRRASVVIDPATQTAEVQEKDKSSRSYSLATPATDKVSQVLALQCMLQHDVRPLQFPVADEDGVEQVRYVIRGKKPIDTPAGRIRTVQLEQVREPDSERKTLLWFAPQRNYALVRLLQQEGGDKHQLIIQD